MYRATGVDEKARNAMDRICGVGACWFSAVSLLLLYLIERVQGWLPLNPQKFAAVPTAFGLQQAASFTTTRTGRHIPAKPP